MSTKAKCSYLEANYTLTVTSLLQQEEDWHLISPPQRNGKTQPEEAYSADTTQQPIHIKASPNQAEHAVVCHWGIVLFLCNTQMIKEFNTASRLMTPLGCRGTQERRRQGLWRILAETGIGSKIYKFIHQKAVFLCHRCVRMWKCAGGREWMWARKVEGERMRWERKRDSKSDSIRLLWAKKHKATGNNHHEKNSNSARMLASYSASSFSL